MTAEMRHIKKYVIIPALMSMVFFAVAFTPVSVLGCRTRGLLAVSIALVSGLTGIGTGVIGLMKRIRGDAEATWWMVTTALLTIPVIGMILMA